MLDVSLVMRLPEILDKVMNSGNWVDRLLKGIAFGFTEVRGCSPHYNSCYADGITKESF